jgi:hypothetical protein
MSLLDEDNPETLISRLAAPLTTLAQSAFRAEAYEAMARLAIIGPGSLYRTIAPIQASHFVPPSDERANWDIAGASGTRIRANKLIAKAPIEHARCGPGGWPLKGI